MSLDLDRRLFVDMMNEEWRLHKSMIGGLGSALFPFMIFSLTTICALIAPLLISSLTLQTMLLMFHIGSLFYGFYVGGFGALGEQVMTRRLGQVNMLLQLPQIYPISFRRVMSVFYIKDSLFYLIYTYIPLVLGIGVVASLIKVPILGVLKLGVTLFLTFMMGMGLSFTVSSMWARSKYWGITASLSLLVLIVLVYPLEILQPHQILLPLGYWVDESLSWPLSSVVIALGLSVAGVLLTKERFEVHQKSYNNSLLSVEANMSIFRELKSLVAKEWLELVRSGNLVPLLSGYTLQLLAIAFISWIFENGFGVPIDFNVVFFSALVGFMGVMTYSGLTSLEHNEYLNILPIGVDSLVKAKLRVYFLLTSGVTVGYVVLIGFLKQEINLVPQSLLVAACTSMYVVAVTAYLTGLWTNTMFFGAKTIFKFMVMVVPFIAFIEIGALILPNMTELATVMIAGACTLGLFASLLIFRLLARKWGSSSFSYLSPGTSM